MIYDSYKKPYFSILFFLNLVLIFFLSIFNSIPLQIISSIILFVVIFFCNNPYLKYTSFYFYITTIFVFFYLCIPTTLNYGIDNFFFNFDLNYKFLVFNNILILCAVFISSLILFNFFKLNDVSELQINYNVLRVINKLILFFILIYLTMTICDSYFNTYFLKIKFFGQLLKKLFSIVFLFIPFYIFNFDKFSDKKLIILIISTFVILIFLRHSRLELMYIIFVGMIYFFIKKKYKLLLLATILAPIFWELFTEIRSPNPSLKDIFSGYENILTNYIELINNVYGRLSTLTEVTSIYYKNLSIEGLSYFEFFKTFLPSFLIGEKNFFSNDWSLMLDFNLIPLLPPYSTTAAPGIIAESYLFQNNLFFLHALFLGFMFFLINKFTYDFPKPLYIAFQLFVFKSITLKDSLILSGFEFLIILFLIIFLRNILLKKIKI